MPRSSGHGYPQTPARLARVIQRTYPYRALPAELSTPFCQLAVVAPSERKRNHMHANGFFERYHMQPLAMNAIKCYR